MKRIILMTALSLSCASLIWGCGKKAASTDLTSTHTTAAGETLAPSAESSEPNIQESSSEATGTETAESEEASLSNVSTTIETYQEGKVSIEYPVISNLNDASVEEKVNTLLKDHALEFLSAYELNKETDSLSIECKVISANRRRITAVYTGVYNPENAAHPANIFYTSTIDTVLGKDMGLTDYADPYTLAGYVLSGDCEFETTDSELKKELMNMRSQTSIDDYTTMFQNADFPYKGDSEGGISFPQVFSYEDQGNIYVSIPVIHALGDYALVKYTPEAK